MIPIRVAALVLAAVIALSPGHGRAHDAAARGGLLRTRDAGATWLPVNPGIFVSGALALAVSPMDSNHLLLGTDSGVWRSRNGGRDWEVEAPGTLVGPAFAAAFDVDGKRALLGGASTLFRSDGDRWRPSPTPAGAAPARALVSGSFRGRVYLAGSTGFYRSDDWGNTWVKMGGPFEAQHVDALMVPPGRPDEVYAVAGKRLWASNDGARSWQPLDDGLPAVNVDVVSADPSASARLWAVGAGQVYRSDDRGQRWRPIGKPIPDLPVIAHAIAVWGESILIATDRGVFRTADAGERWELPSERLPAHLEAGLLVPDPLHPATFYAGFALMPSDDLRQRAQPDQGVFAEGMTGRLLIAAALFVLLVLNGSKAVRHLGRTLYRPRSDRNG